MSKKPSKQRKALYQAPLHKRQKLVSAHLSKELRKQWKRRSLSLRKGDEVKVMRGQFRGQTGKISKVNLRKIRIWVEGIKRKKTTGEETTVSFHPSNLMIINAPIEDPKRRKIIERGMK
jgi:large subunit ribosomal protein L24